MKVHTDLISMIPATASGQTAVVIPPCAKYAENGLPSTGSWKETSDLASMKSNTGSWLISSAEKSAMNASSISFGNCFEQDTSIAAKINTKAWLEHLKGAEAAPNPRQHLPTRT